MDISFLLVSAQSSGPKVLYQALLTRSLRLSLYLVRFLKQDEAIQLLLPVRVMRYLHMDHLVLHLDKVLDSQQGHKLVAQADMPVY